jgi:hypothetical protein
VPPNYPQQTQITNFIYVENTLSIDEKNMVFSVTLDMSSIWLDARLAYADSVTTKSSLDITTNSEQIWKPQIQVTDNVKDEGKVILFYCIEDILSERLTLYKNGTLLYNKRMNIDLKCKFDYSNMPKDKHDCKFIFYALNYNKKYVKLIIGNINTDSDIVLKVSVS